MQHQKHVHIHWTTHKGTAGLHSLVRGATTIETLLQKQPIMPRSSYLEVGTGNDNFCIHGTDLFPQVDNSGLTKLTFSKI